MDPVRDRPDAQSLTDPAPALRGRPIMSQRWTDLTFLHWRVDPELVAPVFPPRTEPDVFDGATWVGLVPFRMVGAGVGRGPGIPWLGTFAETNVRLYSIDANGRRGVLFRSLEASRLATVLGARAVFGLPYMWARMRVRRAGPDIEYTTARRWPGPRGAGGRIVVRPGTPLTRTHPLADFLTARWGLHSHRFGRTLYVPNRHARWPLHEATLHHLDDTLVAAAGLGGIVDREPDSVLWSPGVAVEFGMPYDARRPTTAGSLTPGRPRRRGARARARSRAPAG
ncbi:MAG TPA: DUF2071 domain-containing protein [Pseudonocardia sp.]|nr:DUF2071 domain-containing protein [Pseudonocardia sp.]